MAPALQLRSATEDVAYLFVDFSNLWYAIRAEAIRRGDPDRAIRLHAGNLRHILAGGRPVADSVLVANREIPGPVLDRFRPFFSVELVESGRVTGTEQAGDEMLQNAIYRSIFRAATPGTVVVATGDGAGWSSGRGFCETLCATRRQGFGVEVASFRGSLNRWLGSLADQVGAVVSLDPFYDSITFLEGLRPARQPSLVHRPSAVPRIWSARDEEAIIKRTDLRAA
jgi:hypothetical protein